jgi:hypothetical protein
MMLVAVYQQTEDTDDACSCISRQLQILLVGTLPI